MALGCPVAIHDSGRDGSPLQRPVAAITDAKNFYGTILPIRQWLGELSQRHDLEVERPRVEAAIQARYQRQTTLVQWLVGLAALLGAFIAVSIATQRILRQRAITRTREQIAADLRDELGANLHAIALSGDLAKASASRPL